MKRALVLLTLVAPVIGSAQISTLRHDAPIDRQIQEAVARLKGFVVFGYPDGLINYGRPLSRLEYAVAARNILGLVETRISSNKPWEWHERYAWPNYYWMLPWLGKMLAPELTQLGTARGYEASMLTIKQALAKAGIIVDDPYARFSDVPKGHWADEAIHRMRESGVIRGYPDNTFRM